MLPRNCPVQGRFEEDEVGEFTLKKRNERAIQLSDLSPEMLAMVKELLQKQKIMQAVESREPRAIENASRGNSRLQISLSDKEI